MSISKNIPLSSGTTYSLDVYNQGVVSTSTQTNFGSVGNITPIDIISPLLLGHRSLNNPVATLPNDFINTDFTQKNLITFQTLPVYPSKLISANLVLSCSSIPLYASSFPVKITVGANINPGQEASYFNLISISKYSGVINSNISNGNNTINITSLIQYLTTLPTWISNSRIVLFIDGPASDNQMVRVSTQQSYISLQYNPVVPFSPRNIEVAPGYKQLLVSWSPPLDDGGSSILDYTIEYRTINSNNNILSNWIIAKTSSITSATIDNLDNRSIYIVRVRARNAVGLGSYSETSNSISPQASAAPRVSSTYNSANYTRIRLRRDTSSAWSGVNPVLGLGEAAYETDTRFIKVGDNITEWNNLDYVKVPNSSIQFPPFPPVNLIIGDGEFGISNPRILCSLSNNDYLNIVGRNGITANYSDTHKALVLSLTQPYNPVYSGTLYSPSTSGQPGNVAYDDQWMYVCVKNNFWKKLPLEQYWFDPTSISVSNNSGNYPSMTNIAFSGSNMLVNTDGDPYPALAGYNLTNDGITSRNGFFGSYDIQDQSFNYNFRYRGPSYSSNPQPIGSGIIGIMTNGALFTSFINNPNKIDIFQVPSGLRFNKVFFSDYFRLDPCGGEVVLDRSYRYLNGKFLTTCWNNSLLINSNAYYSGTSYNNNYFRHPDGHSKIVGFCFDGYPLYGPYGYTNPTSSASGVSLMTSSYIAKNTDHHRPPNWKFSNAMVVNDINFMLSTGAFVEDFDFYEGSGILDQYNGRFAVTPEYPEGVYAYYLTFTDDSLAIPKYPYIIGPYSRQQRPI